MTYPKRLMMVGLVSLLMGCGSATTTPQPAVAPYPIQGVEQPAAPAEKAEISGTVSYLERIALAPGAVVRVQLLDTTIQDIEAMTLGETTITTSGEQVPIKYTITYDVNQIQANHAYSINATIMVDGVVRFRTTQAFPVLTNGAASSGDVIVQSMP